jgi:hypothetical protein
MDWATDQPDGDDAHGGQADSDDDNCNDADEDEEEMLGA